MEVEELGLMIRMRMLVGAGEVESMVEEGGLGVRS